MVSLATPVRDGAVQASALVDAVSAVMAARGGFGGLRASPRSGRVADETVKAVVLNARGVASAFCVCSSPARPELVGRAVRTARAARHVLGEDGLGRAVLVPMHAGVADGLSYAVFPLCEPVTGRGIVERVRAHLVAARLFDWLLRNATLTTASGPSDAEVESDFLTPLASLTKDNEIDPHLRARAGVARERILDAQWRPRHVVQHGDLWIGNAMLTPHGYPVGWPMSHAGFVLTDWAGGRVRGCAIYDLVRLAECTGMRPAALANEVRRHCAILRCEVADAAGYLLAAFGHLGANLESFPRVAYLKQVKQCWRLLADAT